MYENWSPRPCLLNRQQIMNLLGCSLDGLKKARARLVELGFLIPCERTGAPLDQPKHMGGKYKVKPGALEPPDSLLSDLSMGRATWCREGEKEALLARKADPAYLEVFIWHPPYHALTGHKKFAWLADPKAKEFKTWWPEFSRRMADKPDPWGLEPAVKSHLMVLMMGAYQSKWKGKIASPSGWLFSKVMGKVKLAGFNEGTVEAAKTWVAERREENARTVAQALAE